MCLYVHNASNRRGINWEGLKALTEQGAQALNLSSLKSMADVQKVLQHPLLVLRHDAAGIARETGILTSEKRLAAFVARLTAQAASRQLCEGHGVQAASIRRQRVISHFTPTSHPAHDQHIHPISPHPHGMR